ncbi:winged helix DNA-binding domain-containing protein [Lysobacter korlensis]|uniref:Winged helix DNA-binding domain-containing protein n=1 Tax=Lysobacter korlensis TaxID=553636 RepID=A0ABV6RZ71_9GAMM
MSKPNEIARWRMHTQHLLEPHAPSASAVVRSLLAVQAENRSQAEWAVACRTAQSDAADLAGLLDTGAIIRTHVLRPTWHFVSAADVRWLIELTSPRVRPVLHRQLIEQHGLSASDLDRALSIVVESLSGRPDQNREQLAAGLIDGGMDLGGQALMLLLGVAELDRLICSGRLVNGKHTYAAFAERVPPATRLDRDEALAEATLRYFTGHGPATERDLAYWATLTLTDVRRGLDQVQDRLTSFTHDGRTFWHAAGTEMPSTSPEPAAHLLQILDELYRGYQDSRMVLDAEGIVPRGREVAVGMAVVDAQLVGSMKRTLGARVRFEVMPYRRLRSGELDALEVAAARYGAFLGLDSELLVRR